MATGRSRGPASRPPRRPARGAPACVHPGRGHGSRARSRPGRAGAVGSRTRRQGPPRPPLVRCSLSSSPSSWCCSARPSRPTSASRATSPRSQDKVARRRQQDVAALKAEQERWQRPGVRRAAGPRAAALRHAGGAGYTVIDAEPADRHRRPRAPSWPRPTRRCPGTSTVWQSDPHRRRARGAPVTAPAHDLPPRRARPTSTPSSRAARPPAARRRRGRAPLPVRPARRRAHRARGCPTARRSRRSYYLTCPRLTAALRHLEARA